MTASGTLQAVYEQAKRYNNGMGKPMNPVIRKNSDGTWVLESSFHSAEDIVFEVDLETFDNYFYSGYDTDFVIDAKIEADFVNEINA